MDLILNIRQAKIARSYAKLFASTFEQNILKLSGSINISLNHRPV